MKLDSHSTSISFRCHYSLRVYFANKQKTIKDEFIIQGGRDDEQF